MNYSEYLVIIPAFNEAKTIVGVIHSLQKARFQVLVVDDGSSDETARLAESTGAEVIRLIYNIGAWHAIQTGMRYALKKNYNYVITFDADGQHLAESVPRLIQQMTQHPCDLLIASCTERGDLSRQLSWRFFKYLAGLNINDLTSGLRLYNRDAYHLLSKKQATLLDYQDLGILLLLKQYQMKIEELEVNMCSREQGQSKMFHSWRQILYYLSYTAILCFAKLKRRKQTRNSIYAH